MRWERNQIALIQRTIIAMAFRWRADDGPTLNASLVWKARVPGVGGYFSFFLDT